MFDAIVINSRHRAIAIMTASMVCLSFSGVLLRLMDGSDPWQINFYRAVAFTGAISALFLGKYGRSSFSHFREIGLAGVVGGVFLGIAGIGYLQALTTTTIANTVFTLAVIPFFSAALSFLFLREKILRETFIAMMAAAIVF